jgi:hypothetical protein
MATETLRHLDVIEPDKHAAELLELLGFPAEKLSPEAALERLHYTIFQSDDVRLKEWTKAATRHFVESGQVHHNMHRSVYRKLRRKLTEMRETEIQLELQATAVPES